MSLRAASRRGERAAMLAVGLVWLPLLLFPVISLADAQPPRGQAARMVET